MQEKGLGIAIPAGYDGAILSWEELLRCIVPTEIMSGCPGAYDNSDV